MLEFCVKIIETGHEGVLQLSTLETAMLQSQICENIVKLVVYSLTRIIPSKTNLKLSPKTIQR